MAKSIEKSVLYRIYGHGRGWCFCAKDFTDFGTRSSIDISLFRLKKQDIIRQIIRGIYDYPCNGKFTSNYIYPNIWDVATTIARKNSWKIIPSGAIALNTLGLSTQVPTKYIFYTNGNSCEYLIDKQKIIFKKQAPKKFQSSDNFLELIIKALQTLGKEHINEAIIKNIESQLNIKNKKKLLHIAQFGTDWLYETVKKITLVKNRE